MPNSNQGNNPYEERFNLLERRLKRVIKQFNLSEQEVKTIRADTASILSTLKILEAYIKGDGIRQGFETQIALLRNDIEAMRENDRGWSTWMQILIGAVVSGTIAILATLLTRELS
mgnify:CR=1 FL=1